MVIDPPPGLRAAIDPALAALFERVRAIRWLAPDAGMALLDADARRFLEERADEHRAAVRAVAARPGVDHPLDSADGMPLRVTRSLREARDASAHATDATELRGFSYAALTWLSVLEHVRASVLRAARDRLGAQQCAAITEQAWQLVRALPGASPAPEQVGAPAPGPFAPDFAHGAPGGEALIAHVWWLLAYGAEHVEESPWAPLIALWERGTCPLATPEGALLVYVPVHDGDELVPEPDDAPAKNEERRWAPGPFFSAGIAAWSSWGRGPKPPEPENARGVLKRANRVGLGPLPGMYAPPNMAFPGVTNWPGPPDLYIVRPPTAPITPEQLDALAGPPDLPTPNPVPRPDLFADAPPPGGVPWYRRLFRRDNNR